VGWEYLGNNLTGPIPHTIGNLARLQLLDLNDNRLTGPIPPEIGNVTVLSSLELARNELTGAIPPTIRSLAQRSYLDLRGNQLSSSGGVPGDGVGNTRAVPRQQASSGRPIPGGCEPRRGLDWLFGPSRENPRWPRSGQGAGSAASWHNDTMPRYDAESAKLAWTRTLEFFNASLRQRAGIAELCLGSGSRLGAYERSSRPQRRNSRSTRSTTGRKCEASSREWIPGAQLLE
jgi:hypothetical protein